MSDERPGRGWHFGAEMTGEGSHDQRMLVHVATAYKDNSGMHLLALAPAQDTVSSRGSVNHESCSYAESIHSCTDALVARLERVAA